MLYSVCGVRKYSYLPSANHVTDCAPRGDIDVVELRAQADASMPTSNNNVNSAAASLIHTCIDYANFLIHGSTNVKKLRYNVCKPQLLAWSYPTFHINRPLHFSLNYTCEVEVDANLRIKFIKAPPPAPSNVFIRSTSQTTCRAE